MTPAEKRIWKDLLAGKNFQGLRFLRQKVLGNYIVDFYCNELKLVVEIDGDLHFEKDAKSYDYLRTKFLNGLGIKVLRFENRQVLENLEGVYLELEEAVKIRREELGL